MDEQGSAETGSGKTAAFALPILQLCVEYKEKGHDRTIGGGAPPVDERGKTRQRQQHEDESLPKFAMSVQDRSPSIAFHPGSDGLRLQSRDATKWAGCRCSTGVRIAPSTSTKEEQGYSFECTVLDNEGLVRVGWSSDDASLQLGTDARGYGYGGTGIKSNNGKYEPFPNNDNKAQFSKDDVIGCHLKILPLTDGSNDKVAAIISFSKNGKMLGDAFEVPRKNNTLVLYPSICIKNAECEVNFGNKPKKPLEAVSDGFSAFAAVVSDEMESAAVINPCDALVVQLAQQKNSKRKGPLAIVIEPTRDLAEQSYRAFCDLGKRLQETPVEAALLVGGIKPTQTIKMLDQNRVDVLVGTPPIIASYMKKGTIGASRCRFFVLDEADELISTDSVKHIQFIFGRIVASTVEHQSRFERLQTCFFSATLHSKEVRDLAAALCSKPTWIDLRGKNDSILPDTVHHCVVNVSPSGSQHLLKGEHLIETDAVHRNGKLSAKIDLDEIKDKASKNSECVKQFKPRVVLDVMDKFHMDQVLIFCRTNLDCDLMEKFLKKAGGAGGMGVSDKYSCRVLAGMRTMEERRASLEAFKDGEVRILIATGKSSYGKSGAGFIDKRQSNYSLIYTLYRAFSKDVAARGIDIVSLPFVINCTIPDKPETYVHRVGRVGRADRMGLAVSLVSTVREKVWFCRKGTKPPCADTRDFDKGGTTPF